MCILFGFGGGQETTIKLLIPFLLVIRDIMENSPNK